MYPTNPFLLMFISGVVAYIIVYLYNKYTQDPETTDSKYPIKTCVLVIIISGLLIFYLKFALQSGVEIVTEHFEIGNPTF